MTRYIHNASFVSKPSTTNTTITTFIATNLAATINNRLDNNESNKDLGINLF